MAASPAAGGAAGLGSPRVFWYAKAVLPLILRYLAMPLDIIPAFIPYWANAMMCWR